MPSDNFNRADGSPGANWIQSIEDSPQGSNLEIHSNEAWASEVATAAAAYYNSALPNDHWARCVVRTGSLGGPTARHTGTTTATFNNYEAYVSSGTNLRIAKHVNGTPTTLNNTAITFVDGDVIGIEVSGTTIRSYQNGILRGEVVDTDIASGFAGVITHGGHSGTIDDFEADAGAYGTVSTKRFFLIPN